MDDEKVDKLFESMQGDPTMGGTVRALAAAVMRLADENLALSEQLTRLAGLAGIEEVEGDADGEEVLETAEDPPEDLAPPEDLSDAEYARLLHETALPLASVKIIGLDGSETEVEAQIYVEGDDLDEPVTLAEALDRLGSMGRIIRASIEEGEVIPPGALHIAFRPPTEGEIAYGKTLIPLLEEELKKFPEVEW